MLGDCELEDEISFNINLSHSSNESVLFGNRRERMERVERYQRQALMQQEINEQARVIKNVVRMKCALERQIRMLPVLRGRRNAIVSNIVSVHYAPLPGIAQKVEYYMSLLALKDMELQEMQETLRKGRINLLESLKIAEPTVQLSRISQRQAAIKPVRDELLNNSCTIDQLKGKITLLSLHIDQLNIKNRRQEERIMDLQKKLNEERATDAQKKSNEGQSETSTSGEERGYMLSWLRKKDKFELGI